MLENMVTVFEIGTKKVSHFLEVTKIAKINF